MPRERDPRRDKAFEIYKQHNGDIDLVEIASQLNLPDGTVRGWKNKDKWDEKLNGTFQTKQPKDTERSKKAKGPPNKTESDDIKHLEQADLTYKQKLFCMYYSKCFNATKSYQKAYGSSYEVANVEGWKLLVNPRIKAEIDIIKQNKLNRAMLSEDDIFQKMIDIAFADISDYAEFGNKEVIKKKADGSVDIFNFNYINLKNSAEIDGTLITEISEGKNGISVKLLDKMKALQWLADRMDLLPVATRKRLEIEQQKFELEKAKANTGEDEELEDDGFMDALKAGDSDLWE